MKDKKNIASDKSRQSQLVFKMEGAAGLERIQAVGNNYSVMIKGPVTNNNECTFNIVYHNGKDVLLCRQPRDADYNTVSIIDSDFFESIENKIDSLEIVTSDLICSDASILQNCFIAVVIPSVCSCKDDHLIDYYNLYRNASFKKKDDCEKYLEEIRNLIIKGKLDSK